MVRIYTWGTSVMSTKDKIVSFFSYLKIREANSIFVLQNAVPQIDFIYAFIFTFAINNMSRKSMYFFFVLPVFS